MCMEFDVEGSVIKDLDSLGFMLFPTRDEGLRNSATVVVLLVGRGCFLFGNLLITLACC